MKSVRLLGQMSAQRAERLLMEWVNLGDGAGLDKVTDRIKAATRLMLSFPETFQLLPERLPELLELTAVEEPTDKQLDHLRLLDDRLLLVEQIRELLRRVWETTSRRDREWAIFVIRTTHDRFLHSAASSSLNFDSCVEGTIRFEKDPATGEVKAYPGEEPIVPFDPLESRRDARRKRLRNYLRRPSDLGEVQLTFDLGADVRAPQMSTFERMMYHFQRHENHALRCAYPECGTPFFFAQRKGQRYCSPDCSDDAKREQNRRWWRENRGKRHD